MDFAVASGHVGDLALEQGSVAITGIGIEGRDTTQLEIATRVAGPVAQALSLIDQPPLGFTSKIGIAPEAASGHVVSRSAHRHAVAQGPGAREGGARRGRRDDHAMARSRASPST